MLYLINKRLDIVFAIQQISPFVSKPTTPSLPSLYATLRIL